MSEQAKARRWPVIVRRARAADRDAVFEFASRTWNGWDYVPRAWASWLAADDGVLLVATAGPDTTGHGARDADGAALPADRPIGVARVAMLSPGEAWLEGIRVDPRVRGLGVATDLQIAELQWAAASGARIVRYATSQRNDASHRLGARHGFELLTAFRLWRWYERAPAEEDRDEDDVSGFDESVRSEATRARQALLADLETSGFVCAPDDGDRWWARLAADPTFASRRRLFEHRGWALQQLSEQIFDTYLEAGEVLTLGAPRGGAAWALALLNRESLPSEDIDVHLGLLVGRPGAVVQLADEVRRTADAPIRFWLPVAGAGSGERRRAQLEAAGFHSREWSLHLLGRPLGGAHPPPAADDPSRLVLADPPAPIRPTTS